MAVYDFFLLYIWFHHYARKDAGWRLFDHKKDTIVAGYFCWPFSFFVIFLLLVTFVNYFFTIQGSLFVIFFSAYNFHKLLFTVEKGQVSYFMGLVWLFRGRGCAFIYLFWFLLMLNGRGWRLMFFFSPSFDMCKEEGKGVSFFHNFFFIIEWLGKAARVFFFFWYVEGGWEGEGLDFF
jgi:hypothetical protein